MGTWELKTIINVVKNQGRDKCDHKKKENEEESGNENDYLFV